MPCKMYHSQSTKILLTHIKDNEVRLAMQEICLFAEACGMRLRPAPHTVSSSHSNSINFSDLIITCRTYNSYIKLFITLSQFSNTFG